MRKPDLGSHVYHPRAESLLDAARRSVGNSSDLNPRALHSNLVHFDSIGCRWIFSSVGNNCEIRSVYIGMLQALSIKGDLLR